MLLALLAKRWLPRQLQLGALGVGRADVSLNQPRKGHQVEQRLQHEAYRKDDQCRPRMP